MKNSLTFLLLLLALAMVMQAPLYAEDTTDPAGFKVEQAQNLLLKLEKRLSKLRTPDQTDQSWQEINALKKDARQCVDENTIVQEKLDKELNLLGESVKGENNALKSARRTLQRDKQSTEQLVSSCRFVLLKSESLLEQLDKIRIQQQSRTLLSKSEGVVELALSSKQDRRWKNWLMPFVQWQAYDWENVTYSGVTVLSLLLLMSLFLAIAGGVWADRYVGRHIYEKGAGGKAMLSFVCALKRYRFGLSLTAAWSIFWLFIAWKSVPALVGVYLFLFFLFLFFTRTFINPISPAEHHLLFPEAPTRRLGRIMVLWGVITCIGGIFYLFPLFDNMSTFQMAAVRLVYAFIYVGVLIALFWTLFSLGGRYGYGALRLLIAFVLVAAVFFEIMGYRNLSVYLIQGITESLLLLILGWLIARLAADFYDSLDEGRYQWQRKLREITGVSALQRVPGLLWLRFLTTILIWGSILLGLFSVWEIPQSKRVELISYLTEGVQIGQLTIVPLRIIIALALLSMMLSIISWFKHKMEVHWLTRSHYDAGARNAIVSISGYAIGGLAIVVALGFAGIDFGTLALIAGALSVGIGFGLQNIVNNFLSGLILLFERPIRKGDWIVVGNTEGYVQDISIRSTQIRTFDRADVIVPNSELISSQVTNWMLHDLRGRVRVPVGVAYGSDVEKVREILLDIAHAHPLSILDGTTGKPMVLFLSFGDSSLNFELRFYIRNIDERLNVISEINFALVKAFRENGIEIPFPQRDLHLRSIPPGLGDNNT